MNEMNWKMNTILMKTDSSKQTMIADRWIGNCDTRSRRHWTSNESVR